ncbi:MAG: hypothetical protein JWN17_2326, partial [Frankiales bacterium]|nr:hypothetical protein [Frankiales bacterium]
MTLHPPAPPSLRTLAVDDEPP